MISVPLIIYSTSAVVCAVIFIISPFCTAKVTRTGPEKFITIKDLILMIFVTAMPIIQSLFCVYVLALLIDSAITYLLKGDNSPLGKLINKNILKIK
jgi:hypothetical protein